MSLFTDSLSLLTALSQTREVGYTFVDNALCPHVLCALQEEINGLNLEVGDHNRFPIQAGTARQVRQRHARSYHMLDDHEAPTAAMTLCHDLAQEVHGLGFDELDHWLLTEIGYQRYASENDHISPHIDRASDQLLSMTITISGSAWVHMYKPNTPEVDYRDLRKVASFLTKPGTVMFLRAPGFGSGNQEIHEVMPPIGGRRDILNLRMRAPGNVLPRPGIEKVV